MLAIGHELELTALDGTNPLGLLAALGTLDVLYRAGRAATLRWTDDLVPVALIGGAPQANDLIDILNADRARWSSSALLHGRTAAGLDDAKPVFTTLQDWASDVIAASGRADANLFAALVRPSRAEGLTAVPTTLVFAFP